MQRIKSGEATIGESSDLGDSGISAAYGNPHDRKNGKRQKSIKSNHQIRAGQKRVRMRKIRRLGRQEPFEDGLTEIPDEIRDLSYDEGRVGTTERWIGAWEEPFPGLEKRSGDSENGAVDLPVKRGERQ